MAGPGPWGCPRCGRWHARRCALCNRCSGAGYQPRPGTRDALEDSLACYEARVFERPGEVAILTSEHLTADEQALVYNQVPLGVRPVFCSGSPRYELPLWMWCGLLGFAFLAGWFACFWGWK